MTEMNPLSMTIFDGPGITVRLSEVSGFTDDNTPVQGLETPRIKPIINGIESSVTLQGQAALAFVAAWRAYCEAVDKPFSVGNPAVLTKEQRQALDMITPIGSSTTLNTDHVDLFRSIVRHEWGAQEGDLSREDLLDIERWIKPSDKGRLIQYQIGHNQLAGLLQMAKRAANFGAPETKSGNQQQNTHIHLGSTGGYNP